MPVDLDRMSGGSASSARGRCTVPEMTGAVRTQKYRAVPISEVPARLHPKNRREGDVGKLVELIRVNGFVGASIVQASSGFFVAGNHRAIAMLQAADEIDRATKLTDDELAGLGAEDQARALSWRAWPATFGSPAKLPIIEREMTDEEAERHLIGDNVASDVASWDTPGLVDDLDALLASHGTLEGTGFELDDLDALRALCDEPEGKEKSDGGLLSRTDVSVAEPINEAERGAVYALGKHFLCVLDVMADWPRWAPLLSDGALFVPYPGPYLALADRAQRQPMVMVQPEAYIAGHILDKWVAVNGEGSYVRVEL